MCLLRGYFAVSTPGVSFSHEGELIDTCTPDEDLGQCSIVDGSGSSTGSTTSTSSEDEGSPETPQDQILRHASRNIWEAHEQITCDGPLPPWPIPNVDRRVSHESLIEVCAEYGLGGDLRGNMGGRCSIDPMPPYIVLGNGLRPPWRSHRPTRLWCLVKCRCTYAITERETVTINGVEYLKAREFPNALIDMANGGVVFLSYASQSSSSATSTYTLVPPQTPVSEPGGIVEGHIEENALPNGVRPVDSTVMVPPIPVSIPSGGCDGRMRIVCGGWMPWWDLPNGFSVDLYDSLHHICATVQCGGLRDANLGGLCNGHPLKPMPVFIRQLAAPALWDDEALRAYCGVKCWCLTTGMKQDTRNRRTGDLVDVGNGNFINIAGYGLVKINANTGQSKQLVAPQQNGKDPWENRAAEGLAALKPQKVPLYGTAKVPTNMCGGACSSMMECSKNALCMCLAVLKIGLDPVYPRGLCVRAHYWGTVGKRSLEVEESSDYICLCNKTYISKTCCERTDGMVWESHESKLPSLQRYVEG